MMKYQHTSITSTSGVVLDLGIEVASESDSEPIAITTPPTAVSLVFLVPLSELSESGAGAGDEQCMQVETEFVQFGDGRLVAAYQRVVAKGRRNRDGQTERSHDQRFTHRTGNLVDAGLTGCADRYQCMIDAPDVPNKPTNGAVEPTEASTAMPACSLPDASSMA